VRRGDLVTVSLPGDLGKPRPALIVQADQFAQTESVSILPLTSTMLQSPLLRCRIDPKSTNGLRQCSQVMIDKPMTVRRSKVGETSGRISDDKLIEVNRLLALFLGIV